MEQGRGELSSIPHWLCPLLTSPEHKVGFRLFWFSGTGTCAEPLRQVELLPHLHVTPSLLADTSGQGCLGGSVFEATGSSPLLSLPWTAHKQFLSSLANRNKILLEFRLQHANSSIFQAEKQGWSKVSRQKTHASLWHHEN